MKTLEWRRNELIVLDQTKLPAEETYRRCTSWQDVKDAISVLAVRGAPAIGVAAAYGLVLGASELLRRKITDTAAFSAGLATVAAALDAAYGGKPALGVNTYAEGGRKRTGRGKEQRGNHAYSRKGSRNAPCKGHRDQQVHIRIRRGGDYRAKGSKKTDRPHSL